MEIERINENTVKFFISYRDIEDRGFEKEEIWYNRERSEQLFWQMMDEVNDEEDFFLDGPLWIQVKALRKGLEIVVSKANPEQELQDLFTLDPEDRMNLALAENDFEEMFRRKKDGNKENSGDVFEDTLVLSFSSLEELIQFSHYIQPYLEVYMDEVKLYHMDDTYQLYIKLLEDEDVSNDMSNTIYHIGSEFGEEVETPLALLEEYGHPILMENVFSTLRDTFEQ